MHLADPAATRQFGPWLSAALLILLPFGPRLAAQEKSGERIYKDLLKSTVWVVIRERRSADTFVVRATGSGALVDKNRMLVLTNSHVVGNSKEALVFFPTVPRGGKLVAERSSYLTQLRKGEYIAGEVVAKDAKVDLALIKIESVPPDAAALKLATESPSPAQKVHSVGNPGGSGALWVYTSGTVRQVYHKTWRAGPEGGGRSEQFDAQVVETQSPTNPGDSGGPLVNERGELVGVTHGGASGATLLSVFIDVSEVKKLLKAQGVKIAAPVAKAPAEKNPLKGETKLETGVDNFSDDPEKLERQAGSRLKLAKILVEDGKTERAQERMKDIIKDFPKTKAAEEAKKLLEKLGK